MLSVIKAWESISSSINTMWSCLAGSDSWSRNTEKGQPFFKRSLYHTNQSTAWQRTNEDAERISTKIKHKKESNSRDEVPHGERRQCELLSTNAWHSWWSRRSPHPPLPFFRRVGWVPSFRSARSAGNSPDAFSARSFIIPGSWTKISVELER